MTPDNGVTQLLKHSVTEGDIAQSGGGSILQFLIPAFGGAYLMQGLPKDLPFYEVNNKERDAILSLTPYAEGLWADTIKIAQSRVTSKGYEFSGDAETAAREFPRDVLGRAHHTTGSALDAALEGDLHGPAVLGAVGANGAELDAGFFLAIHADLGVDNFQVRFMLVGEVLERHQNVVDVHFGQVILFRVFRHKIHLSFIYR